MRQYAWHIYAQTFDPEGRGRQNHSGWLVCELVEGSDSVELESVDGSGQEGDSQGGKRAFSPSQVKQRSGQEEDSPSEVKRAAPPSEVEQVKEAVEPLELVGREVLLGEVVVAETMELEAAAAMGAWVVLLL